MTEEMIDQRLAKMVDPLLMLRPGIRLDIVPEEPREMHVVGWLLLGFAVFVGFCGGMWVHWLLAARQ